MKHSTPNITPLEINAVTEAIRNGHLADGVLNESFEKMFKDLYGYENVVTLNSGTSAMHLGLLAMGVGHGDEVIVTPLTMVATVNVILACGAVPVFADVCRDTYNLDPQAVKDKLTSNTKVVMPVDLFGVPADIKGLRAVLPTTVKILEDSIEALGSRYQGEPIGTYADAGAFGFYPNKQITTCEGGVLYSKNKDLIDKVRRLSRHGVMAGDLAYQSMGYNMRLSDVHAALGMAQLSRLGEMQDTLLSIKAKYDKYFVNYRKQVTREGDFGTEFIYCIELDKKYTAGKDVFITKMADMGIPIKPYFNVLHTYPHLLQYASPCPVAEEIGRLTVALPFHHAITDADIEATYKAYTKVINENSL